MAKKRVSLSERILRFISPEPTSGCWLWTGSTPHRGYGHIWSDELQKNVKAHRASYALYRGPIPDGQCVLHDCDNPSCVNPAHLFLGSNKENTQDMLRKGRNGYQTRKGPANKWTKLSPEAVSHIKRRELKTSEYAALYGVSWGCVYAVLTGASWRDHGEPRIY